MSPRITRAFYPPFYRHVAGNHAWGSAHDPREILLPFSFGSFSRSSNASFMTGARALSIAADNVLRLEDRGDGEGPAYLLEGAVTNLLAERQASNFSNTAGPVINTLGGTSLIDGRTQDTVDWTSDFQIFDFSGSAYAAGHHTLSAWVKFLSGSCSNFRIADVHTHELKLDITDNPSDWTFYNATFNYPAARNGFQSYRDTTNAATFTSIIDGNQMQTGKFPTSYVDVNGASASTVADQLTFASGIWPSRLASGRWVQNIWPYFANDEVDSDVVALSIGGADDELRYNATSDAFEVFTSGVSRGVSSGLTFSRHQKLTLTWDWVARELTIAGATTGNGTVSLTSTDEWPTAATIRWGGRQGGALECFARYSEPEAA